MRRLMCGLTVLSLAAGGCVQPAKVPETPVPAVKPQVVEKPPMLPPTAQPVIDKEINETNAWDKAKLLREELDREQRVPTVTGDLSAR